MYRLKGSRRHSQSAPQGYGKRVVTTADSEPMEVHRAGVLLNSSFELNLPDYRELLCPKTERNTT